MASQRLYFVYESQLVISNDVREKYKTIKQSKASIAEESHLVVVEENE
jgi:hypothetical protein